MNEAAARPTQRGVSQGSQRPTSGSRQEPAHALLPPGRPTKRMERIWFLGISACNPHSASAARTTRRTPSAKSRCIARRPAAHREGDGGREAASQKQRFRIPDALAGIPHLSLTGVCVRAVTRARCICACGRLPWQPGRWRLESGEWYGSFMCA